MTSLFFKGFIRDIRYNPQLRSKLKVYPLNSFDINTSSACGIIELDSPENTLAFSKWVSPKRTRSYPFARIYNTYYLNTKKVTIIPIIKDEGLAGDNDRINFITFSWMSLMNVYIILAWYEKAEMLKGNSAKLTKQQFNPDYVKEKIQEIANYQLTALHWNTTHFQQEFNKVYRRAVDSYQTISQHQGVAVHPRALQLNVLEQFNVNNYFSLENFKQYTLPNSLKAAQREVITSHALEYLADGDKGIFEISNYLGGEYYLTVDEVYQEYDTYILQESKNTSRKFPAKADIKDGLFKLILFANLERLLLDECEISFIVCLKITGQIVGSLSLPADDALIGEFCKRNRFSRIQSQTIMTLAQECTVNHKLSILITSAN
ncbi:hypothetical protein [Coleofasciculus chthonoplastes]|uniref:hypothetical protein n=1 Tax=Coleofasciculus chthonoplastes TaxID=64178 RepID=UPI0032F9A96A